MKEKTYNPGTSISPDWFLPFLSSLVQCSGPTVTLCSLPRLAQLGCGPAPTFPTQFGGSATARLSSCSASSLVWAGSGNYSFGCTPESQTTALHRALHRIPLCGQVGNPAVGPCPNTNTVHPSPKSPQILQSHMSHRPWGPRLRAPYFPPPLCIPPFLFPSNRPIS